MSNLKVNHITNKGGDYGPVIAGVSTVNSTGAMRVPSGNTGMRVEYSSLKETQIVKDGLILHIDIANPDCYQYGTGGNKVYDLSGAGVYDFGTPIGDCVYSPDGGGCLEMGRSGRGGIEFPLVDMNGPLALRQEDQDALTACSWIGEVDMTSSANVVASLWYATNGAGWMLAVNEHNRKDARPMPALITSDGADGSGAWARPGWPSGTISEYDPRTLTYWQTVKSQGEGVGIGTTAAVSKDTFTNLSQTVARWHGPISGATTPNAWGTHTFINGLKCGMASPISEHSGWGYTGETGVWAAANREFTIGCTDNSSGSYMKGKISVVMIYNRELTHAEIQQNYNAQRYRFGR